MPQRFQYAVLRYVPNVIRDEAVNVGVVVRDLEREEFEYRFLPRSATVRKLAPQADKSEERKSSHAKCRSSERCRLLHSG